MPVSNGQQIQALDFYTFTTKKTYTFVILPSNPTKTVDKKMISQMPHFVPQ